MVEKSYLPAAIERTDLDRLGAIDENELREMAEECARWLRSCREFRHSLVTPAARTVWAALGQREFDEVAAIHDRLESEVARRGQPVLRRCARSH
ncbi:hypothetical protein [Aureimonas sp. SA4125]|uniref:hypothetical protein n=1 Tax=Aureimonas sp. SA4125 TaxID=2826993 RepID=UPI001CC49636|nr:hypothetical protein [Aureimonas sp. SA4125]